MCVHTVHTHARVCRGINACMHKFACMYIAVYLFIYRIAANFDRGKF